jgi:putative ATPase
MDIFSQSTQNENLRPLSEKMRPQKWDDFFGMNSWKPAQQRLVNNMIKRGFLTNLILWGPPGTGKTTFARLIGNILSESRFLQVNAVDTGAKKLKEIASEAKYQKQAFSKSTIVFIDEIHRLNKAQQDVLLPFTETGDLILLGATTENPSYSLNNALLSRCQVLSFQPLNSSDAKKILNRVSLHLSSNISSIIQDEGLEYLINACSGDIRALINNFELVYNSFVESGLEQPLDLTVIKEILIDQKLKYDKHGDYHHDIISAFIKSIRGSDPDAALFSKNDCSRGRSLIYCKKISDFSIRGYWQCRPKSD